MEKVDKTRRLRERVRLALPVRVMCRESSNHEWVELSRLVEVTPFGARFTLAHPMERGRILHLTLPMPRQLRCFDHIEDQYRVWALVRHVERKVIEQTTPSLSGIRFEVGVAFIGKNAPASYQRDPTILFEVDAPTKEGGMWAVYEKNRSVGGGRIQRSEVTRVQLAVVVTVELFDEKGAVQISEQSVTENISRRGAAIMTSLPAERGRFVRVTSMDQGLSVLAAVRARRVGADGIPRLHVEFVDQYWPLEGIEA